MSFKDQIVQILEDESVNLLVAEGRAQTKKVTLLLLLERKQTLIKNRLHDLITVQELQHEMSVLTPQITIAYRQYRYANLLLDQHIQFFESLNHNMQQLNE